MLGNSFTSNNNLPSTLYQVFDAAQHAPTVSGVTGGGLTLYDHGVKAGDPSTQQYAKLVTDGASREWIVLQDQSQMPGFYPSGYWSQSLWGAQTIVGLTDATSVYFMTWGYRNGDSYNPSLYPNYVTMQNELEQGYQAYSRQTSTPDRLTYIAPVGLAFKHIYYEVLASGSSPTDDGTSFSRLYSSDGSHPSREGTYLAACVIYAAITGSSPEGLTPAWSDLNPSAAYLQGVAARTVLDNTPHFSYPWSTSSLKTAFNKLFAVSHYYHYLYDFCWTFWYYTGTAFWSYSTY